MRDQSPGRSKAKAFALAIVISAAACSSSPPKKQSEFRADTPFSKKVAGSGDAVCWSVKRAFLTQGYMLDRSGDSAILSGTKDTQQDEKTNVTLHLQTTCVDNHDGTSTVFASAAREVSKLQKVKQSISAGVSIATVTVPTSSEDALRVVSRETIQDPAFYNGFYTLVETFAAQESRTLSHNSHVQQAP